MCSRTCGNGRSGRRCCKALKKGVLVSDCTSRRNGVFDCVGEVRVGHGLRKFRVDSQQPVAEVTRRQHPQRRVHSCHCLLRLTQRPAVGLQCDVRHEHAHRRPAVPVHTSCRWWTCVRWLRRRRSRGTSMTRFRASCWRAPPQWAALPT